jgi:hypothetical protein
MRSEQLLWRSLAPTRRRMAANQAERAELLHRPESTGFAGIRGFQVGYAPLWKHAGSSSSSTSLESVPMPNRDHRIFAAAAKANWLSGWHSGPSCPRHVAPDHMHAHRSALPSARIAVDTVLPVKCLDRLR